MHPPERKKIDYEKVKTEDFVSGEIDSIEYDENHQFNFKGEVKHAFAVRFVFRLDGYNYLHRSRWMKFNTGEKSTLYNKYLCKLVKDPEPDMDFDLDVFVKMRVKTIWNERNDFQDIENIFAEGNKVDLANVQPIEEKEPEADFPDDLDSVEA